MRSTRGLLVAALLAAIAAVGGGYWWLGREGSTEVENWVRVYLSRVLDTYLKPKIQMGELDYQAPRTVIISSLKLESGQDAILEIQTVKLDLAEVPRPGRPLLIEQIHVQSPVVRLIRGSAGWVGWGDLIRKPDSREVEARDIQVSDFLRMKEASIQQAALQIQSAEGELLYAIDSLNTKMASEALTDGWYKLDGQFGRDKVVEVTMQGRLNLNTGQLALSPLLLHAAIGPASYAAFPAAAREIVERHAVSGALDLSMQGNIELADLGSSAVGATLDLKEGQFQWGAVSVATAHSRIESQFKDLEWTGDVTSDLSGATISATFEADLRNQTPIKVETTISGMSVATIARLISDSGSNLSLEKAQGSVAGKVVATLSSDLSRILTLDLDGAVQGLALNYGGGHYEAARLDLRAQLEEERVQLLLEGMTSLGRLSAKAQCARDDPALIDIEVTLTDTKLMSLADLAPQLQDFTRDYQPEGVLRAHLSGRLDLRNRPQSHIEFTVASEEVATVDQGRSLSAQNVELKGSAEKGMLSVVARGSLLGGDVTIHAAHDLTHPGPFNLTAKILDIQLQDAVPIARMSGIGDHSDAPVEGRVSGDFDVRVGTSTPNEIRIQGEFESRDINVHSGKWILALPSGKGRLVYEDGVLRVDWETADDAESTMGSWSIGFNRRSNMNSLQIALRDVPARILAPDVFEAEGAPSRVNATIVVDGSESDWRSWRGQLLATLSAGTLHFESNSAPLDHAEIRAQLADQRMSYQSQLDVFGGKVRAEGAVSLSEGYPIESRLTLENVLLERLQTRQSDRGRETGFRGRMSGVIDLRSELSRWRDTLAGTGEVSVEDGRLVEIPVIKELLAYAGRAAPFVPNMDRDRGRARFQISGDRITFGSIELEAMLFSIRGTGDIYFTRAIDLVMYVEVLAKATNLLGSLGDHIRDYTSSLMEYRVSGSLDSPQITVVPLGGLSLSP